MDLELPKKYDYTISMHLYSTIKSTNVDVLLKAYVNNSFLFSYKDDNNSLNTVTIPCNKFNNLLNNIFLEYLISNKNKWKLLFNMKTIKTTYSRVYHLNINITKLNDVINMNSITDRLLLDNLINKKNKVKLNVSGNKLNIISDNLLTIDDIKRYNKKLFLYQKKNIKKMKDIEDSEFISLDTNISVVYNNTKYNINSMLNNKLEIYSQGGLLCDEMGLGKTLTALSLVRYHTNKNNDYKKLMFENNRILTNSTLILCPNHLLKQWESEIKKHYPELKVATLFTKTQHNKITYKDVINYDIILTSYQFMVNWNSYLQQDYKYNYPSSYSFNDKLHRIKIKFNTWKTDKKKLLAKTNPLFELFKFKRIILDEAHEVFASCALKCRHKTRVLLDIIRVLKAQQYWYVSGTPFTSLLGLMNCFNFIKLRIKYNNIVEDVNSRTLNNNFMNNETILKILSKICIRHSKSNVINEIKIPGYEEKNYWVEQTDFEKTLYSSALQHRSKELLQQLCCHPFASDKYNRFNKNSDVDIDVIKQQVLDYNINIIKKYTNRLENLRPENKEYNMLKHKYTTKITESKYLLKTFKEFEEKTSKNIDIDCTICMDKMKIPTLTTCGHTFCNHCIKMCLKYKNSCPTCRKVIKNDKLIIISKNKTNNKYGGKLSKIISIIKEIITNKQNRIIIFSQWDNMLKLIHQTLVENKIYSSYLRGNAYMKNAQVKYFKRGYDMDKNINQIIMLSLKNSASGTNLTEATHIMFVEPINEKREVIKAIENQAIGRACRLGQKNKVNIIRVLTKKTIEEEIYNKYYV